VYRIGVIDEREDERQDCQRETGKNQLEKGAGVVKLHQEALIS
jgi:hypothetical protein